MKNDCSWCQVDIKTISLVVKPLVNGACLEDQTAPSPHIVPDLRAVWHNRNCFYKVKSEVECASKKQKKNLESEISRPVEFRGGIILNVSVHESVQYLTKGSEGAAM